MWLLHERIWAKGHLKMNWISFSVTYHGSLHYLSKKGNNKLCIFRWHGLYWQTNKMNGRRYYCPPSTDRCPAIFSFNLFVLLIVLHDITGRCYGTFGSRYELILSVPRFSCYCIFFKYKNIKIWYHVQHCKVIKKSL